MKSLHRYQLIFTSLLAAVALTGCAALSGRLNPGTLPFEVVASHSSTITDVRTFETDARLYVAGTVRQHRGYPLLSGAHVDIQLLDRRGNVLAERSEDIDAVHPRQASARGSRYPFRTSFPVEKIGQATGIRIISRATIYHALE